MKKILLLSLTLFFIFAVPVFASIGVGISNGKITINEKLKPGAIYHLPPIAVFNTGTDKTDYEMVIAYNEKQIQRKPESSWFTFSPQTFSLPSHGTQQIKVTLTVPLNAYPGDYFTYLEAHPAVSSVQGITEVGIAAASKLTFTVIPANSFSALYFRVLSLFMMYAPWSYIILSSMIMSLIIFLFQKKFKLQIGIRKKE